MLNYITEKNIILKVLAIFSISLFTISCTTQEFAPPESEIIYRLKFENLGNDNYKYHTVCYFYYRGDDKIIKKLAKSVPDTAVFHPGDPARILAQSKKGAAGVSIDVLTVGPTDTPIKLILIEGIHTGKGFKKIKVLAQTKGIGSLFIRYGQYY